MRKYVKVNKYVEGIGEGTMILQSLFFLSACLGSKLGHKVHGNSDVMYR